MNWSARASLRPASSSYDRRTLRSAFSVDTGQHTGYIFRSIVCRSRAFIFGHLFGDSFAHLFGQPAARGTSGPQVAQRPREAQAGVRAGVSARPLRPGHRDQVWHRTAHCLPHIGSPGGMMSLRTSSSSLIAVCREPHPNGNELAKHVEHAWVALSGTPWALRGHSGALRGTPGHSVAFDCTQWHSVALTRP